MVREMRRALAALCLFLAACHASTATPTPTSTVTGLTTTEAPSDTDTPLPAGQPCAAGTHAVGDEFAFACANHVHFTVQYEDDDSCAVVSAGGQTYRLGSAIAASGARYSDGRVEFWEHHGDASLTGAAGGPYANCRAPAQ